MVDMLPWSSLIRFESTDEEDNHRYIILFDPEEKVFQ